MRPIRIVGALALALAVLVAPAKAEGSPANVAALQTALKQMKLYRGAVDGVRGPLTRQGVVALQRRRGLRVDGKVGRATRRALGWRGRPGLGRRAMRKGSRGWDVAALQYLLQRAGHGSGRSDGVFGHLTQVAVRRAQRDVDVAVDGIAGRTTLAALRRAKPAGQPEGEAPTVVSAPPTGPARFLHPVRGPIGDGFGAPRGGGRLHQGLDFPVQHGTPVGAAAAGTTIFAGRNHGGYGNLVVVQHELGFTTWYAHLSRIAVGVGQPLAAGARIGHVGSTGFSTGPHLHFEIRHYDTPIDPLPQLLPTVAARISGVAEHHEDIECSGARRGSGAAAPAGASWIARERLCVHE